MNEQNVIKSADWVLSESHYGGRKVRLKYVNGNWFSLDIPIQVWDPSLFHRDPSGFGLNGELEFKGDLHEGDWRNSNDNDDDLPSEEVYEQLLSDDREMIKAAWQVLLRWATTTNRVTPEMKTEYLAIAEAYRAYESEGMNHE